MDRLRTEYVQSREKPATARGTLVGDPFALYLIGEVSIQIVLALPINGKLVDVVIGDWNRIDTRVVCIGGIRIGNETIIHTSVVLNHRVIVEDNAQVGACSFVIRRVKTGTTVHGNPAKKIDI